MRLAPGAPSVNGGRLQKAAVGSQHSAGPGEAGTWSYVELVNERSGVSVEGYARRHPDGWLEFLPSSGERRFCSPGCPISITELPDPRDEDPFQGVETW